MGSLPGFKGFVDKAVCSQSKMAGNDGKGKEIRWREVKLWEGLWEEIEVNKKKKDKRESVKEIEKT